MNIPVILLIINITIGGYNQKKICISLGAKSMALYSEGKGKSKKTSVWLLNHVSGTLWKIWPKLFKPDIRNPLQSSPILTILIPVWFISLVCFYLTKLLFCDFFDLKVVLD